MVTSTRAQSHPDGVYNDAPQTRLTTKKKSRLFKRVFAVFSRLGYDQFALKMTKCVARSKEPSFSKVQFVAIIIRILDVITYGRFL